MSASEPLRSSETRTLNWEPVCQEVYCGGIRDCVAWAGDRLLGQRLYRKNRILTQSLETMKSERRPSQRISYQAKRTAAAHQLCAVAPAASAQVDREHPIREPSYQGSQPAHWEGPAWGTTKAIRSCKPHPLPSILGHDLRETSRWEWGSMTIRKFLPSFNWIYQLSLLKISKRLYWSYLFHAFFPIFPGQAVVL